MDPSRLLHCISQVESGGDDSLVGPNGELSKYQISRSLWYEHRPTISFFQCYGVAAEQFAEWHLERLRAIFGDSVYWLAYAWNGGVTRARHDRLHAVGGAPANYAQRVWNLYYDSAHPNP